MEDDRRREESAVDLAAARSGDAAAMERLLLPCEPTLRAVCRGMLGDPTEAEDAVQETFYRGLKNLHRYRQEAKFSTWLTQIAIHVCTDWRRRRRPQLSLSEWTGDDDSPGFTLPRGAQPEQRTLNRMVIAEALQTLKPERRAAWVLRESQGWSMEEIGQAMNWNVSRVKVELYRARVALAEWVRRREEAERGEERR